MSIATMSRKISRKPVFGLYSRFGAPSSGLEAEHGQKMYLPQNVSTATFVLAKEELNKK